MRKLADDGMTMVVVNLRWGFGRTFGSRAVPGDRRAEPL